MTRILLLLFVVMLVLPAKLKAQRDSIATDTAIKARLTPPPSPKDSLTNQDAIYNRPFINLYKNAVAVGGYMEANGNYFVTNGVPEGFSMEFRRFNIFLYSAIRRRIKFLSELEFEHGTREINLETAMIDFEIHPAFTLRGGIILPPIGGFNLNHDSPKWDIIDRPIVSTQLIPSTLSDVGAGFHGKLFRKGFLFAYDFYVTNGLRDGIIQNSAGRTFLQAGKSPLIFETDNNGEPMFAAKLTFKARRIGELGLSYYGGTYNTFRVDGQVVDQRRNLSVMAADFSTGFQKLKIQGEFAFVWLDRPESAGEMFGKMQWGGYVDFSYAVYSWLAIKKPLFKKQIIKRLNPNLQNRNATLNLVLRLETADFNMGRFTSTGDNIRDDIYSLTAGISLNIAYNTLIRFNYRYQWITDILGNPTTQRAGFQAGFASYF